MSQLLFTGSAQQGGMTITAAAGVNLSAIQTGYVICVAINGFVDTYEANAPATGQTIPLKSAYNGPTSAAIATAACLSYLPDGTPLLEPGDTEIWPLWNRLSRKVYTSLAAIPTPGIGAGNYAAGNDPRIIDVGETGVLVRNLDPNGLTDSGPAILAALASLPSGGGTLYAPRGSFLCRNAALNKPFRWVGQGSGSGITGANPTSYLFTDSASAPIFTINCDGWTIRDQAFRCTAPTPTAGALVYGLQSIRALLADCEFYGGWSHVEFVNGYARILRGCNFEQPRKYGVKLADTAHPDAGDDTICESAFGASGGMAAGSAAVRFESGGGLRYTNNKVNGPFGSVAGTWDFGVDLALPSGTATSDLIIAGNSFENINKAGARVSQFGSPANGTFRNILVGGMNEFAYMQTAVLLGDSPDATYYASLGDLLVSENLIQNCTNGVWVKYVDGGRVGKNYYNRNVAHPVIIDAAAQNITVDPQVRDRPGFVIENASDNCSADYTHRSLHAVGATTPQALYTLAVAPYRAGRIKFTAAGLVANVGTFVYSGERLYSRDGSGNVSLQTVGSDSTKGASSSAPINWDVTTTQGSILITLTSPGGTGIYPTCTLAVDGQLVSLKVGV